MEGNATSTQSVCGDFGALAASVWSPEEKHFIRSLWQPSSELLWLGLSVNTEDEWQWQDGSKLSIQQQETGGTWSILDDSMPDLTSPEQGKCAALSPSGDLIFPNCSMNGTAVACKLALRKVYAWSSLLYPSPPAVAANVQRFERLLPPVLTTLPSSSHPSLAERVVPTDTSCAFACYSVPLCQAFELSCRATDLCQSYQCVLLPGLTV
ncbi:methylthioribose-1-phosphate isomerase [Elysia marginata]|uniref:Methylthioribose-1-phosphate isomerase n=1 Tax=Elysia marginata TaxID=1093978 RepID=A0AAV4EU74_9GAST|nr:methylthioribose-1-phosphate isomerase [Elysia marginata]